jgi:hypothetical protein
MIESSLNKKEKITLNKIDTNNKDMIEEMMIIGNIIKEIIEIIEITGMMIGMMIDIMINIMMIKEKEEMMTETIKGDEVEAVVEVRSEIMKTIEMMIKDVFIVKKRVIGKMSAQN